MAQKASVVRRLINFLGILIKNRHRCSKIVRIHFLSAKLEYVPIPRRRCYSSCPSGEREQVPPCNCNNFVLLYFILFIITSFTYIISIIVVSFILPHILIIPYCYNLFALRPFYIFLLRPLSCCNCVAFYLVFYGFQLCVLFYNHYKPENIIRDTDYDNISYSQWSKHCACFIAYINLKKKNIYM